PDDMVRCGTCRRCIDPRFDRLLPQPSSRLKLRLATGWPGARCPVAASTVSQAFGYHSPSPPTLSPPAMEFVRRHIEAQVQSLTGLAIRSEEHTSGLQSREKLVCRLLA